MVITRVFQSEYCLFTAFRACISVFESHRARLYYNMSDFSTGSELEYNMEMCLPKQPIFRGAAVSFSPLSAPRRDSTRRFLP